MTIGNAMAFIRRGRHNSDLRGWLNSTPDKRVCDKILLDEGLPFSQHQFEETYRHQLTLCQEAETAD